MELFDRMLELSGQGFYCAQILMILALESEGKEDGDLVRAMSGLNGGLGFSGNVCGALTGGCCLLGYFLGKGEAEELEDPEGALVIREFVDWFRAFTEVSYGGFACEDILEGNPSNKMKRCPELVEAVFLKCMELLLEHGVVLP
ncbi:MAG: C_GCAxxG_C_C family protein [Lachnospiraceae bacterium]|nr:C_GCAxxG_C_C family protein [Lachnospiraceae bacterium]